MHSHFLTASNLRQSLRHDLIYVSGFLVDEMDKRFSSLCIPAPRRSPSTSSARRVSRARRAPRLLRPPHLCMDDRFKKKMKNETMVMKEIKEVKLRGILRTTVLVGMRFLEK